MRQIISYKEPNCRLLVARALCALTFIACLTEVARAAIVPMQLNLQANNVMWDRITDPLISGPMTAEVARVGGPLENVTGWQLFLTIVPRAGESSGFLDFASVDQAPAGYIFAGQTDGAEIQIDAGLPYVFFAFDDCTNVAGVDITAGGAGRNLVEMRFAPTGNPLGKFDIIVTAELGSTQWSAPPQVQVPPDPPDSGDREFDNFKFSTRLTLATVTVVPESAAPLCFALFAITLLRPRRGERVTAPSTWSAAPYFAPC